MITVLSGGVGGARMVRGLAAVRPPEDITVLANTGDDMEVWGLKISPDPDIVMYTLAGLVEEDRGWGVRGDTFHCLAAMERLGDPAWFHLGDRDLATHLWRTRALRNGMSLSEVTRELCRRLGVRTALLPMSDEAAPTVIVTQELGEMHFEEYLVRHGAGLTVTGIRLPGPRPAPGVLESILEAEVVVVAPSNPLVSIGPVLAVPGVRAALCRTPAPVVGVSPLIGGKAVKGPAERMLRQTGYRADAAGVAALYRDFLDGFVIDQQDAELGAAIEEMGLRVRVCDTLMRTPERAAALAREVLTLAGECRDGNH